MTTPHQADAILIRIEKALWCAYKSVDFDSWEEPHYSYGLQFIRSHRHVVSCGQELLPCPFCASAIVMLWNSERSGEPCWCVFCESCEAEGPHSTDSVAAVEQWNRRYGAVRG